MSQLWALALHHMAELQAYDAKVADTATLLGRTLEPWRAILAIAYWLTDCGMTNLAPRIEGLAKTYQQERRDLEPNDLMPLVIQALCEYGVDPDTHRHASTPINPINPIRRGSLDTAC